VTRAEIIETMARAIEPAVFHYQAGQSRANRARKDATAALAALEAAGLAVVPVEPTEAMYRAAYKVQDDCAIHNYGGSPTADDYWTAMIAAAQGAQKP
jgi:hypothetical protein